MESQWKRYAIFLSSTFMDLDAERDAIKFDVINMLNQHYKNSKVEFQAIDLRSGINTANIPEDKREDRILDICFSAIDRARPFFIGLLGGRYGWTPSDERINHVLNKLPSDKQALLDMTSGLSVTEMEILYGAIGDNGRYLNHSLFYYRKEESYSKVPLSKLSLYLDDSNPAYSTLQINERREKRQRLKDRITDIIEKTDNCDASITEYTLEYDEEKECFNNIDKFVSLVFTQLCYVVNKEIEDSGEESHIWHVQESQFSNLLQSRFVADSIDKTEQINSEGHQLFITGDAGIGKTVLLSQLFERDAKDSKHKHIAFIGVSPFSFRIRTILIRWLIEMGVWNMGDDIPTIEELSDADLFRMFDNAVDDSHSFYLDHPGGLPYSEQGLGWIKEGMIITIAGDEDAWENAFRINPQLIRQPIIGLTKKEKSKLISNFSSNSFFEMPNTIVDELYSRDFTPEKLILLLRMLSGLSTADYEQIRSQGGQIEDINFFLHTLYTQIATQEEKSLTASIDRLVSDTWRMGGGLKAFEYIAISPLGLRETDLASLLGPQWDITVFLRITYYLDSFFIQNPNNLCWQIKSTRLKKELIMNCDRDLIYKDLFRHLCFLPDSDFLKQGVGVYLGIKAHCPPEAIPVLGSRDMYSDYDDVANWFFWASNILETEEECIDDLNACCNNMSDSQKSVFLRHYFAYGCGFNRQVPVHLSLIRSQFLNVDVSHLDVVSSFDLGWLMVDADTYLKRDESNLEERERLLTLAMAAFRRTLDIDPGHGAAKNMIVAAGSSLLDVYIREKRFEEFSILYNSLNKN